jgi:glucosamine--fructose-6-phosphate aminotransferase (isomerizing)
MEIMKKLEGAYALLIKSRHYPGEMVAAKRGSPMIVGIKEGSNKKNAPNGGLTHRCVCLKCLKLGLVILLLVGA